MLREQSIDDIPFSFQNSLGAYMYRAVYSDFNALNPYVVNKFRLILLFVMF